MKKSTLSLLLVALFATVPAFGRIGETREQCDARYGKPKYAKGSQAQYSTRACGVTVFFNGRGVAETVDYQFRTVKADENTVADLVARNFGVKAVVASARIQNPDKLRVENAVDTFTTRPVIPDAPPGTYGAVIPQVGVVSVITTAEFQNLTHYVCMSNEAYTRSITRTKEERKMDGL